MSYRQLTLDERYQIEAMRGHFSQAQIARKLRRSPSTISRELRRNLVRLELFYPIYDARRAARLASGRRIAKGLACRKLVGELGELVEGKLRLGWSPQQISGRLRLESGISISHETIYQHIMRDEAKPYPERKRLRYCLRSGGYTRTRFRRSKMADRTRLRKKGIGSRPSGANERSELGHWERDVIEGGKGGAALLTLIDRRSRYLVVRKVRKKNARRVAAATRLGLRPHGAKLKTLTNDNGLEFAKDDKLQEELGIPIYFTEPGKPWQRGSIENANGLVRQYIHKGADLRDLPSWVPRALEETLNYRPRKTLGFRTPYEVHFDRRVKLMTGDLLRFGIEISRQV
jgi:IS30 family transposase